MKRLFAAAALLASFQYASAGELSVFSQPDFRGARMTVRDPVRNFQDIGFNDRASSIVVHSGSWEVCEHKDFGGHCMVLERGEYRDLSRFDNQISSVREVGRPRDRDDWRDGGRDRGAWRDRDDRDDNDRRRGWRRDDDRRGPPVELYSGRNFGGDRVVLVGDVHSLRSREFNDRAGSLVVREGEWEVCEHDDYRGRCEVYGPGRYPGLGGLNNEASSVRRLR
ncbi:beta/gamma crystallin-related protein [Massilia sp. METH4]|uniref:beta/gamma crystallin-related protein n=1 Tax=Massilia sp. METH4 TaxID=3123041 RepID=UPI0030CBE752